MPTIRRQVEDILGQAIPQRLDFMLQRGIVASTPPAEIAKNIGSELVKSDGQRETHEALYGLMENWRETGMKQPRIEACILETARCLLKEPGLTFEQAMRTLEAM